MLFIVDLDTENTSDASTDDKGDDLMARTSLSVNLAVWQSVPRVRVPSLMESAMFSTCVPHLK